MFAVNARGLPGGRQGLNFVISRFADLDPMKSPNDSLDAAATATQRRRARGRPAASDAGGADVLLRNARAAFAKGGYHATSAREIARVSGVDAALVGHHFGSKETLWAAVVEQIADEVAPMIERIRALHETPELSPRQRVEQAMAFFIDQVFAMPDVGMFFSTAATEHGERLDFLVDRLVRPVHDVFLPLISRAMKAGEMPARDPEILFSMIANGVSKTVSYSHVLAAFSSLPARPAAFKREVLATAIAMLG